MSGLEIQISKIPPIPNLRVGEIGISGGGQFGEHKGPEHPTGNAVDIGLFRSDGKNLGLDYHNTADYDQETTQQFLSLLDRSDDVDSYYFNDPGVTGDKLQRVAGHDNHIHINFKPCK